MNHSREQKLNEREPSRVVVDEPNAAGKSALKKRNVANFVDRVNDKYIFSNNLIIY